MSETHTVSHRYFLLVLVSFFSSFCWISHIMVHSWQRIEHNQELDVCFFQPVCFFHHSLNLKNNLFPLKTNISINAVMDKYQHNANQTAVKHLLDYFQGYIEFKAYIFTCVFVFVWSITYLYQWFSFSGHTKTRWTKRKTCAPRCSEIWETNKDVKMSQKVRSPAH